MDRGRSLPLRHRTAAPAGSTGFPRPQGSRCGRTETGHGSACRTYRPGRFQPLRAGRCPHLRPAEETDALGGAHRCEGRPLAPTAHGRDRHLVGTGLRPEGGFLQDGPQRPPQLPVRPGLAGLERHHRPYPAPPLHQQPRHTPRQHPVRPSRCAPHARQAECGPHQRERHLGLSRPPRAEGHQPVGRPPYAGVQGSGRPGGAAADVRPEGRPPPCLAVRLPPRDTRQQHHAERAVGRLPHEGETAGRQHAALCRQGLQGIGHAGRLRPAAARPEDLHGNLRCRPGGTGDETFAPGETALSGRPVAVHAHQSKRTGQTPGDCAGMGLLLHAAAHQRQHPAPHRPGRPKAPARTAGWSRQHLLSRLVRPQCRPLYG